MVLQRTYIAVLNFIWRITGKLPARLRVGLVFACCLCLALRYTFFSQNLNGLRIEAEGTLILCAMIAMSIDGEIRQVRWNPVLYYSLLAFGIGVMIISLIHPVGRGYALSAFDVAFVCPALYLVWANREDRRILFDMISGAFALIGAAYFLFSLYLAVTGNLLFVEGRVTATTTSPNNFGVIGVGMILSCEYLILRYSRRWPALIFAAAAAGAGAAMIMVSFSRTSLLAAVAATIVMIVFLLKKRFGEGRAEPAPWKRIICVLVIFVITTMAGMTLDDIQRHSEAAKTAPTETEQSDDQTQSMRERLSLDKDVNEVSSGRVLIWKTYLSNLSLLGGEMELIEKEITIYKEVRAHNAVIDYLYRCGVIVGGIYIIFFIALCAMGIRYLIDRRRVSAYSFWVTAVIAVYAVYAMLEISSMMFIRMVPCILFLSIGPVMTAEAEEPADNDKRKTEGEKAI